MTFGGKLLFPPARNFDNNDGGTVWRARRRDVTAERLASVIDKNGRPKVLDRPPFNLVS